MTHISRISHTYVKKRQFAFLPKTLKDGRIFWLRNVTRVRCYFGFTGPV